MRFLLFLLLLIGVGAQPAVDRKEGNLLEGSTNASSLVDLNLHIPIPTKFRIFTKGGYVIYNESSILFNDTQGILTSPNYPNNYDNNINLQYTIQVPIGFHVRLVFDTLQTEECCDKVFVYDGADSTASSLDTMSGNRTGSIITSSGPYLTLVFATDLSTTDIGFYGNYVAVPDGSKYQYKDVCPDSTYDISSTEYKFGVITSADWPDLYPNSMNCDYFITSAAGSKIALQFFAFNTEGCCDFVELYDGPDKSSPLIARLSGSISNFDTNNFSSSGNHMYVFFSSDLTENSSGFSALFVQS